MQTPTGRETSTERVFPTSIHLHNLCSVPPSVLTKKWFRPEHSNDLLQTVRLRIVVSGNNTVHEAVHQAKTVSPRWQHINEFVAFSDLSAEEYESIAVHFDILNSTTATATTTTTQHSNNNTRIFKKEFIHPSKLKIIHQIPEQLPLNAVVLTFSDETIRVSQTLYRLLVETKQISVIQKHSTPSTLKAPSNKETPLTDASRFQDHVFSTLDQVTPPRKQTRQSLLETDDESKATPIASLTNDHQLDPDHQQHKGGAFRKSLRGRIRNVTEHSDTSGESRSDLQQVINITEDRELQDLMQEQLMLEKELLEENAALSKEMIALESARGQSRHCMDEIQRSDQRIAEARAAARDLQKDLQKASFLLEAQRIRLFCDLQAVYPITQELNQQYRIRGLLLHCNLSTGTPDDELSAAVGHLAHLVSMMAKFLHVQLRYLISFQASSSCIQDDRGQIFPLFTGRSVDKNLFETGFSLLGRNVDFLCETRSIKIAHKLHVLAKIKRIYECVIDGY